MPALIHPETSLALSPARLRALLAATGAARAVARKEPLDIARHLFEGEHPSEVIAAFAAVERFTQGEGPSALDEGARLAGYAVPASASAEGPADVAADVVLAARAKGEAGAAARKALARAHVRMDRFLVARPSYELVGDAGATARPFRDAARELERLLVAWQKGSFRALWLAEGDDGRLHAAVLYVAPPAPVLAWPPDAKGRASAPSRVLTPRVLADIVRIDRAEARFLATPAREPHLSPLARAFGGALYADVNHYGLRPSFSFKTIQALGAAGFARHPRPPGVRAWSIVGCQWDSGREERIEARSDDALASLEARTAVHGGYFPRLTLRVEPEAKGKEKTAPVDLFLQLPHLVTVSRPRHEALARAAAKALGVFDPGALPDDVRTLAPWVHFEWRWREVLGDDAFELLMRTKIIARVKAKKGVGSPEHRWLGSSVKLTPLAGEDIELATPLDFSLPAFEVEPGEAHAWRLDDAALARHLGAVMGLRPGSQGSVPGVLALGALVVKSGRAQVYYAAAPPPPGVVASIRAACKLGTTPVVCVPRGKRLPDEGLAQVEMDLHEQFGVAGTTGLVTGRMATALGVEDEVEAWRLAAPEEALVLDRKKKKAWLVGVELLLVEGTYRLLERLVIEAGRVVDVRTLGEYISAAASDSDVVVRKRRVRLMAQIAKSFAEARRLLPKEAELLVLIEGRGGYRLGVGFRVV